MHVGVITYQTGHLKTWQVVQRMITKGYTVTVFAFPFKHRPPRSDVLARFQDRPDQLISSDVLYFYHSHNAVSYVPVANWDEVSASSLDTNDRYGRKPTVYLHCIGKIVPKAFIADRTILNCHPGLLPQNRGVDALKWSIVKRWPVGITLHVIDEAIDRGMILARMRVPVVHNDSLSTLCRRAYDLELDLMCNFEHHLKNLAEGWMVGEDHPCSHALIALDADQLLQKSFGSNIDEFCRLSYDAETHAHESDVCFVNSGQPA